MPLPQLVFLFPGCSLRKAHTERAIPYPASLRSSLTPRPSHLLCFPAHITTQGFIRAETIAYDDFVNYNGFSGAKEAGAMRLEGKEYVVQEGDVLVFRAAP